MAAAPSLCSSSRASSRVLSRAPAPAPTCRAAAAGSSRSCLAATMGLRLPALPLAGMSLTKCYPALDTARPPARAPDITQRLTHDSLNSISAVRWARSAETTCDESSAELGDMADSDHFFWRPPWKGFCGSAKWTRVVIATGRRETREECQVRIGGTGGAHVVFGVAGLDLGLILPVQLDPQPRQPVQPLSPEVLRHHHLLLEAHGADFQRPL